jgi:hypothetical protein
MFIIPQEIKINLMWLFYDVFIALLQVPQKLSNVNDANAVG